MCVGKHHLQLRPPALEEGALLLERETLSPLRYRADSGETLGNRIDTTQRLRIVKRAHGKKAQATIVFEEHANILRGGRDTREAQTDLLRPQFKAQTSAKSIKVGRPLFLKVQKTRIIHRERHFMAANVRVERSAASLPHNEAALS